MTLPLDIETPVTVTALGAVAGTHAGPADGETSAPVDVGSAGPAPHVTGVDLSLTETGVATRHSADIITTSGHRDDTLTDRRARLSTIRRQVLDWCTDADLVVIEAPSYGSKGGSAHDRAGLWWLVVSALILRGVHVLDVSPKTRAKYATGDGNAGKDKVLTAAIRRLPMAVDNNNAADAAWLAAIGHDLLDQPLCVMPAANRTALEVLRPRLCTGDLT